jgi:pimeloyl-ACP methyl ester carboxylesterase
MGGMTCMDYTLTHPEKVLSLTMVGAGPDGLELEVPSPPIFDEAEAAYEAKDWEKLLELETRIWFDGIGRTPEQVDPEKRALAVKMNRLAFDHYAKGLGKRKRNLENVAAKRLNEITIPVLVMVGQYDVPYQHAAADYMAAHIKDCRKVMLEDTAHLPSMEQPEAFNRALSAFLRQQSQQ